MGTSAIGKMQFPMLWTYLRAGRGHYSVPPGEVSRGHAPHLLGPLAASTGKVPVGATRWRPTLLQARFWNSGGRGDSPADCSGMWQFQLLPLSTHHDTILSKKAAALVVKSDRSRTFASSCVATKAAMPGRPD